MKTSPGVGCTAAAAIVFARNVRRFMALYSDGQNTGQTPISEDLGTDSHLQQRRNGRQFPVF
jgi:hypothetical protein